MNVELLGEAAHVIEFVNMGLALAAGVLAIVLFTVPRRGLERSWQLVSSAILVFAFSELVGGILGENKVSGPSFEPAYLGLQTGFIILLLAGVIDRARSLSAGTPQPPAQETSGDPS